MGCSCKWLKNVLPCEVNFSTIREGPWNEARHTSVIPCKWARIADGTYLIYARAGVHHSGLPGASMVFEHIWPPAATAICVVQIAPTSSNSLVIMEARLKTNVSVYWRHRKQLQKHVMVARFRTLPITWSALARSQAESSHDKWQYNKSITHWAVKQWIFHAEIAGPNSCWSRRNWDTLFQHLIKQRWMSFGESVKVECVCQG